MDDEKLFEGDWVIALCPGATYIGRHCGIGVLHPAYQVLETAIPVQTGEGRFVNARHLEVVAPLVCVGDVRLDLRESSVAVVRFEHLDEADRENFKKMVLGARKAQKFERAKRAGLTLATALPKGAEP